MLVLTRTDVEELLDLDKLVDALAAAHAELSADTAKLVPRVGVWSGAGVLGAMPGYAPTCRDGLQARDAVRGEPRSADASGAHRALRSRHRHADGAHGRDVHHCDAHRCGGGARDQAAVSRPDSSVLAILGTGVQSRAAQEMFPRVRDFTDVRVAGRGEYEDAVRGADVVHCTTGSPEPIVRWDWLAPVRM